MRNLLIAIVLLLGIIFIFVHFAEVEAIIETLRHGNLSFILLAFALQGIWFLNVAACYRAIYRALGMEWDLGRLILVVAAANFVNVVAPSAGVGGIAMFISESKRMDYSPGRVTLASALAVLFDYFAFLCVLFLGLIVLFRRNNLHITEIIASAIFVLVASILALIIYLGMRSAEAMGRVLAWMAHQVNRILWVFIHRQYLSEERAHTFALEASEGLHQLRQQPKSVVMPVVLSLNSKALLIFILFIIFLAFDVPLSIGTLIGGFSIGYLFLIVSPTPAGIGFVEGALTLGLRSLYVPLGAATVLTLAYRGVTLWVPLLFGMFAFRYLDPGKKVSFLRDEGEVR